MDVSEMLYRLDCDFGDDLAIYAQSERYGEQWYPIVDVLLDVEEAAVVLMADLNAPDGAVRSSVFDGGLDGEWLSHVHVPYGELFRYSIQLSFLCDTSSGSTMYPVAGMFSFAEDEDGDESLVFYPAEPIAF